MKRLLIYITALCLLLGCCAPFAAIAEDTRQDAILNSDTGSVTLYQKPNGNPIGVAPSSLWVWYDFIKNKGQWVNILMGGVDDAGVQLSVYVKRADLLDVDGMDLNGFIQKHPQEVPKATLLSGADVYRAADGVETIGYLAQGVPVSALAEVGEFSFIRVAEFSGFVRTSSLEITGAVGDLQLDTSAQREATVYCSPGNIVPIYSSCSETGKPPQYAPHYRNGDTVQVLREVDGYMQITYPIFESALYGGFIPARFFRQGEEYAIDNRAVRSSAPDKRVNLRYAADQKAGSMGLFCDGTPAQVLLDEGAWVYVQIGDITGYMMADYLIPGPSAAEPQVVKASAAMELTRHWSMSSGGVQGDDHVDAGEEMTLLGFAHQIGESQTNAYVRRGDDYGYAEFGYLRPTDETHALSAKVNTKALHLREWPEKDSNSLARVGKGKKVTVLIHGDEWSYIRYESTEGFAMSRYLAFGGN